jgi:hypothetical protein
MPCNCDHLEATELEVECSRIHLLLDELDGKGAPDPNSSEWRGYDGRAYNERVTRDVADKLTARLCERVGNIKDLTKYSLELQVWARDHARADAERRRKEEKQREVQATKKAALKKLTAAEKKALGLRS